MSISSLLSTFAFLLFVDRPKTPKTELTSLNGEISKRMCIYNKQ